VVVARLEVEGIEEFDQFVIVVACESRAKVRQRFEYVGKPRCRFRSLPLLATS